ncbi:hypothetical protein [Oxynema aestuarii]|uniref:Uncharacterized protein n=1 Tax=Oxynema aestuarii AP17 TaxID=2064643 RepID=A0A6H1U337_9CYAN|nr:hypothetical protein [Oxynema aestuarii]QIZ73241.1 hypothetical protein HCG48_23765 [Oxynema aestuarii AP17]
MSFYQLDPSKNARIERNGSESRGQGLRIPDKTGKSNGDSVGIGARSERVRVWEKNKRAAIARQTI